MASTISRIREVQVLQNIGQAIDDRSFVPSGIVLGTGQASVVVGAAPSMKTTNFAMSGAAVELDLSPTNTWTAQWQFTSITNQDDLRRLRNVYALIVSTNEQYDALVRYFRAKSAGSAAQEEGNENTVFRGLFAGLTPPRHPAAAYPASRNTQAHQPYDEETDEEERPPVRRIVPWQEAKNFIIEGDSIDCRLFQEAMPPRTHGIPFRRWLFWHKAGGPWLPDPPDGPVESVGHYGNWELGVTSRACLDDFVILLQGATPAANSVTSEGPKYMLQ